MEEIKGKEKTPGSNTSDSIKRLGSKRGYQEFLFKPVPITIEQELDEELLSQQGSHKILLTETNYDESCSKFVDNHNASNSKEQKEMELSSHLKSTIDSESKP